MRYLPNGKQMSEADAHTIHEIGIPSLVLMERAALQIVETMHKKNISTEKSLIVCGSGNNGGDGFAVARLLTEQGKHADVLFAGKEASLSEECRCQKQIVENMKFTEEQIQLAYELKQQGMTHKMIERKTGISISTQQRAFKQMMK